MKPRKSLRDAISCITSNPEEVVDSTPMMGLAFALSWCTLDEHSTESREFLSRQMEGQRETDFGQSSFGCLKSHLALPISLMADMVELGAGQAPVLFHPGSILTEDVFATGVKYIIGMALKEIASLEDPI